MANCTKLQALLNVGEWRACLVVGTDQTVIRYQSPRNEDEKLHKEPREPSYQRPRLGYRGLHILPHHDGTIMNRKKTDSFAASEHWHCDGATALLVTCACPLPHTQLLNLR